jgi:hypothetical protein
MAGTTNPEIVPVDSMAKMTINNVEIALTGIQVEMDGEGNFTLSGVGQLHGPEWSSDPTVGVEVPDANLGSIVIMDGTTAAAIAAAIVAVSRL